MNENKSLGDCEFTSENVGLLELSDLDADVRPTGPRLVTPASLLAYMRLRVLHFGAPLPEGYVAPPGIDLAALLKQVPWPEPRD
jgi:hypothetical protein